MAPTPAHGWTGGAASMGLDGRVVWKSTWMLPRDVRTGLSMGVASLQRDHLETGAALIEHADDNLYQAKDAGKGCTCGM